VAMLHGEPRVAMRSRQARGAAPGPQVALPGARRRAEAACGEMERARVSGVLLEPRPCHVRALARGACRPALRNQRRTVFRAREAVRARPAMPARLRRPARTTPGSTPAGTCIPTYPCPASAA